MSRPQRFPSPLSRTLAAVLLALACSDPTTPDSGSGFANEEDVRRSVATDSIGNVLPPLGPSPVLGGPASLRGVVRAPTGGASTDSIMTARRVPGVVVRAYPLNVSASRPSGRASPTNLSIVGGMAATATTNAAGEFQLPTMPAGMYKLSFAPASAPYVWTWVFAEVTITRDTVRWWVTLPVRR